MKYVKLCLDITNYRIPKELEELFFMIHKLESNEKVVGYVADPQVYETTSILNHVHPAV